MLLKNIKNLLGDRVAMVTATNEEYTVTYKVDVTVKTPEERLLDAVFGLESLNVLDDCEVDKIYVSDHGLELALKFNDFTKEKMQVFANKRELNFEIIEEEIIEDDIVEA